MVVWVILWPEMLWPFNVGTIVVWSQKDYDPINLNMGVLVTLDLALGMGSIQYRIYLPQTC